MKKIKSNIALWLCVVVAFSLVFTSCQKDEPMIPVLSAFGPLPVVRGDSLNFLGENLDLVNELVLPDSIVITKDNFIAATATSFTIIVPQETMGGKVKLNYAGGTIISNATIKFEEPIKFSNIVTPAEAVRAGDVISIKGDYLANIVSVVFSDNVPVDTTTFALRERGEIQLPVPQEAISGLIYLVDAEGEQYYSATPLTVIQPEITSFGPDTIKAGDVLSITGTNLDLVQKITFAGGTSVEAADFATQTLTAITVETPANLADGAITYVSYAQVSATTAATLITSLPKTVTIAAETVYKTGLNVVISGSDLDLVSALQFTGGADISAAALLADGKITVAIPDNATDGIITLKTLSGKTIETPAITLVVPTNLSTDKTGYLNEEKIVISGDDLDLITVVTLKGESLDFAYDGASKTITASTTKLSGTGDLVATLKNGTEVTVATNIVMTPITEIVVTSITPAKAQAGTEVSITGKNFYKMESMAIGGAKVVDYVSKTDTTLVFKVAQGTPEGDFTLDFTLTTGVVESSVPTIQIVGAVVKVPIWSGSKDLGGWSNFEDLSWNKTPASTTFMSEIKSGATFVIKGNASAGAQLKIMNPTGWVVIEDVKTLPTFDPAWGVVNIPEGEASEVRFKVLDASLSFMQTAGLVMGGKLIVIEEVYLEYPAE